MLMIACVKVLFVSIALALAWKFLWLVINSINSFVKSTFARSLAPARTVPKPAVPASPKVTEPDLDVAK